MFTESFEVEGRSIGKGKPCFIIAEVGSNHAGKLSIARRQIEAAAKTGADAVKFQAFRADEFVADDEVKYSYRTNDGRQITQSQKEMFAELEMPAAWHKKLKKTAENCGVIYFSSVADPVSLEIVVESGVSLLKLASEDLINMPLLERVVRAERPVILSRGMADEDEIDRALDVFLKSKEPRVALLHCVSLYPLPVAHSHLGQIELLQQKIPIVGYSDHTEGSFTAGIAAAKGVQIIEKHFTMDKDLPGPDQAMSASAKEFKEMVARIRLVEKMCEDDEISYCDLEEQSRVDFRRSIVAAHDIGKGTVLKPEHLEMKRPAVGYLPYETEKVIGSTAKKSIKANQPIKEEDLQDE